MIDPKKICPGCMNEKLTEGKCPICGYSPDEPVNPAFLAPGTVLDGRYIIGKVLDNNGEGVTYLGYDAVTGTVVNVREFFPTGLCERSGDGSVMMLSGCEFDYNEALLKFIDLSNKLFALNELPALFDVLDVREASGTAYRITKSVPGISLREFLMRNGGVLKWDQARSLFAPLVSSVSALHKAGIIHRGISPDTLVVGKDGKLRINGFCIPEERTAKSSLTSQIFPGFAAVEQYGEAGTQGTWTDVYAFAATIYRTLVGNPPPEAIERLENDNMTIPAHVVRETPKTVLETLANALQVLPDDRTQTIDEMRRGLSASSAQPQVQSGAKAQQAQASAAAPAGKSKKKKDNSNKMYALVAGIVTACLLAGIIVFVLWAMGIIGHSSDSSSSQPSSVSAPSYDNTQSITSKTPIEFNSSYTALPKFEGLRFSEVAIDHEFADLYKFKIVSKQYSDTYAAGQIISQTPAAGTTVEANTTVEVVVSLGPYYKSMIDVSGLDKDQALLELLKAGYQYNNIIFSYRYDEDKLPGVVIGTDPERGISVNTDARIEVIINSYQGNPTEPVTGGNTGGNTDGGTDKNSTGGNKNEISPNTSTGKR